MSELLHVLGFDAARQARECGSAWRAADGDALFPSGARRAQAFSRHGKETALQQAWAALIVRAMQSRHGSRALRMGSSGGI